MSVFWKKKTNKGRVVYDRPKNSFTYRDALRIIRKIEEPSAFMSPREFANLVRIQALCARKIAKISARSTLDLLSIDPDILPALGEVITEIPKIIGFFTNLRERIE